MSLNKFQNTHTSEKLSILTKYLTFYTNALKNQGFALTYIDAFAGSGEYSVDLADMTLFENTSENESKIIMPGSAKLAMDVMPKLDALVFIEANERRAQSLENMASERDDKRVKVVRGDANETVVKLCKKIPWHRKNGSILGMRAVMFLDPYGMQVEWKTLKAISDTRAIDLWYLFPTNAVTRQAAHSLKKVDEHKSAALDRVLGGDWWRQVFYDNPEDNPQTPFLPGLESPDEMRRNIDSTGIEKAFHKRLSDLFPYVAPQPRRLYRDKLHHFSLFFTVANDSTKAKGLASNAAVHILKHKH